MLMTLLNSDYQVASSAHDDSPVLLKFLSRIPVHALISAIIKVSHQKDILSTVRVSKGMQAALGDYWQRSNPHRKEEEVNQS